MKDFLLFIIWIIEIYWTWLENDKDVGDVLYYLWSKTKDNKTKNVI